MPFHTHGRVQPPGGGNPFFAPACGGPAPPLASVGGDWLGRFAIPLKVPIVPGESPFRVAGVVYQSLLAFVAAEAPGGLPRLKAELREPSISAFLDQRFHLASAYDAVPLPYVGQALARVRGVTFPEQLRDSNRWSARSRFFDFYRALVPIVSEESLTLGLARVAKVIQPFGALRMEKAANHLLRGERTGVPHVLVAWWALSSAAFLETALSRIGVSASSIHFETPIESGHAAGQALYAMPFELRWT